MTTNIHIIITTYNRVQLLERTLSSLSKVTFPKTIKAVWVIENGGVFGVEDLCNRINFPIPLLYRYHDIPGTAASRKYILDSLNADEFALFFDDDIKFCNTILESYHEAITEWGSGHFFGGPVEPDYEQPPPSWMTEFFPCSVQGFNLGPTVKTISRPIFLGANLGAFVSDIREAGNFNTNFGPGSKYNAVGHETELQERLIKGQCKGVYLPTALIRHYVPKESANLKWLRQRHYKMGIGQGIKAFSSKNSTYPMLFGKPRWVIRAILVSQWRRLISRLFLKDRKQVLYLDLEYQRHRGYLNGFNNPKR